MDEAQRERDMLHKIDALHTWLQHRYEAMEAIVRAVAEDDPYVHSESNGDMECPYCPATRTQYQWLIKRLPFTHEPDCIVLQARALVAQAKGEQG